MEIELEEMQQQEREAPKEILTKVRDLELKKEKLGNLEKKILEKTKKEIEHSKKQ